WWRTASSWGLSPAAICLMRCWRKEYQKNRVTDCPQAGARETGTPALGKEVVEGEELHQVLRVAAAEDDKSAALH
ncbi:MAG TPA: hypothetical protein VGX03_15585, partial [Candidatus Binatia bacterium]|nr:hypothetical protein [Candidatus Binatia bacterium]